MPGSSAAKPIRQEPPAEDDSEAAERESSESLLREAAATLDTAVAHARKVAATAAVEARLAAASAAGIAVALAAALALLLVAWICLLALGVWLSIQAGLPVWAALTGAVVVNVAGILICRTWFAKLTPNLGFTRTRRLLP
ncbi:MAG TPA: hypothetical protein VE175_02265 [Woeseiaceae bacterium]|nr:hypothetical protein [Woeseiaceae bacterium]